MCCRSPRRVSPSRAQFSGGTLFSATIAPNRKPYAGVVMKPPLVAIADDDASFANYLKTFLDGRGYQSRVYSHGEDLLSAARMGELPDVVLLDVMMPGLDGLATLRSLK